MTYLFTSHDPFNIHKSLGLLCLTSYLYRFCQLGKFDMGFGSYTPWIILLHVLLNLSSFVFSVPHKRHPSGVIIWKEYQLHSLIFVCRYATLLMYTWLHKYKAISIQNFHFFLGGSVLLLSNVVSQREKQQNGTVRGFIQRLCQKYPTNVWVFSFAGFVASLAQVFAWSSLFFSRIWEKRFSSSFVSMGVIQITPFLMTLYRKAKIDKRAIVCLYMTLLLVSLCVHLYDLFYFATQDERDWVWFSMGFFVVLRFKLGWSKFSSWGVIYLFFTLIKRFHSEHH